MQGGDEGAIVLSRDAEQEERTSGLWCATQQDRWETMRLGMLHAPEYPQVEYSRGHTMCEGREAWLRFHMHPQTNVEQVRQCVLQLVDELWRETA